MSKYELIHPQMLKQLQERAARCSELERLAAEVVAELREQSEDARRLSFLGCNETENYHSGRCDALGVAADLVAKKLGVP